MKPEDQTPKTLKDVLPFNFMGCEYDDTLARKFAEVEILTIHEVGWNWPGKHKNICMWVELKNGYAVGWNENPSIGLSFPSLKMKKK